MNENITDYWTKLKSFLKPVPQVKGLINLALRDPQELKETTHMKSYRADTLSKYTKYIFQYKSGSSLFIKFCLEKSRGSSALSLWVL